MDEQLEKSTRKKETVYLVLRIFQILDGFAQTFFSKVETV